MVELAVRRRFVDKKKVVVPPVVRHGTLGEPVLRLSLRFARPSVPSRLLAPQEASKALCFVEGVWRLCLLEALAAVKLPAALACTAVSE